MNAQKLGLAVPFLLLLGAGIAIGGGDGREDRFRQLEELLPTPNAYRTASGAPGHEYWQQRADHDIRVEIDDESQHLTGTEQIDYHNNSPDTLTYLWLQLDPNIRSPESHASLIDEADIEGPSYRSMMSLLASETFQGGCNVTRVYDIVGGAPLAHVINDTMMRVDLPRPLAPGKTFHLGIHWDYAINNHSLVRGRTGFEFFEDDGNYLYEMAQWFPRMCAYTDVNGWQHKQFLGRGEFTLEFGDYRVAITVPDDHVVAATGVLQNPKSVMTPEQRDRLERARTAAEPMFIVTPDEAKANESSMSRPARRPGSSRPRTCATLRSRPRASSSGTLSAWTSTARPSWRCPLIPNEGEPLWSRYSTHAIAHTLDVYSKFTFPYPYPVAMVDQRARRRDGVPDDLLQRPTPRGGRDLLVALQVRVDLGDHPRGRPQLLPDDRELRRAPVDLDGRGAQHLRAVPGRAGVGGGLPLLPRRAGQDRRLHG